MRRIVFKSIKLQHFGKHDLLSKDFGPVTRIGGENGSGKSTIQRSLRWIFNGKDDSGNEISGLRQHGEDGADGSLDCIADLTVNVDGEEVELQKNFHVKTKKTGEFDGNATDCAVGGIPKKTKDYDAFVNEIIPDQMCLTAKPLLQMAIPEQRKWLEKSFSEYTQDEIIDKNPEYEEIRQALKNGSVEENLKALRAEIFGNRTRPGLMQERDGKPAKIEEVEVGRAGLDIEKLNGDLKNADAALVEIRERIANADEQATEYDRLSDGIMELKFKLSDMERKANEGNAHERREFQREIHSVGAKKEDAERRIAHEVYEIARIENDLKKKSDLIEKCREEWKTAHDRVFDESSLVCPYCGREYIEEKKDALRIDFESHKADELKAVTEKGNRLKDEIEKGRSDIDNLNVAVKENEKKVSELTVKIEKLQAQYDGIPVSVDITDTAEYMEIQKQISERGKALDLMADIRQRRAELNAELENAVRGKTLIENSIRKWTDAENRVKELRQEQIELSQKIADIERKIKLFKDFDFLKCSLLEESVNRHFQYVKWKLSDTQVNGDLKQVCYCMVDGEPYHRNLNKGARILAEIDICVAVQKKYGLVAPVIMDDIESLDPWRIPEIENQLILIGRTDDRVLTWDVYGSVGEMQN